MKLRRHEFQEIDINRLVILPQVRQKQNKSIDELIDSIVNQGLLNEINVAFLTRDELQTHIDFVNALWGEK